MRFQDPLGIRFVRDGGKMEEGHLPVLADEVIEMLAPAPAAFTSTPPWAAVGTPSGSWRRPDPDGRLLGLDADPAAIARVQARLGPASAIARPSPGKLPRAGGGRPCGRLRRRRRRPVRSGLSSFQLADRDRGLRLPGRRPARHALRHQPGVPASELLASLDTAELTALFRRYGEEPKAPRIARAIVDARRVRADRHGRGAGRAHRAGAAAEPAAARRTHPATRVFQALRIAVNEELDALQAGLRSLSTCCDRAGASSS
jgi:16S rRNA (cytosine1402-N4)-methyltransferase